MYILQNNYHQKFDTHHLTELQFVFLIKCPVLVIYNIQYSIINYSHHTVCYIPRLYLCHNWKFVLFHNFTHLSPSLLLNSANHYLFCFFFSYFRFHIELKSYSICLYLSDLFHSG